jgi:hypothetical protein
MHRVKRTTLLPRTVIPSLPGTHLARSCLRRSRPRVPPHPSSSPSWAQPPPRSRSPPHPRSASPRSGSGTAVPDIGVAAVYRRREPTATSLHPIVQTCWTARGRAGGRYPRGLVGTRCRRRRRAARWSRCSRQEEACRPTALALLFQSPGFPKGRGYPFRARHNPILLADTPLPFPLERVSACDPNSGVSTRQPVQCSPSLSCTPAPRAAPPDRTRTP